MATLGKLFRTIAFKLAVLYSLMFAGAASLVVFNIERNVRMVLRDQIAETIEADIRGLSEQYAEGGLRQAVEAIERRIKRPGGDIYLLTTSAGQPIVGNVAALPPEVIGQVGMVNTLYERPGESASHARALARIFILPGHYRLFVGHDIEEVENLNQILQHALVVSLAWLILIGAVGGLFVARRVLLRVDAMSASAKAIMGGDLTERLPVYGSGDELDRLAENLNAMLARIETLMKGLREVSDNIAHDLRTPLTRLRNDAEAALRAPEDRQAQQKALNRVIDEADGLIEVFNALLLIARTESGAGPKMEVLDISRIAQDVAELYEAAAEEKGVAFTADIAPGLCARGNRELIAQALANLLDNGLKYGVATAGSPASLRLCARRAGSNLNLSVEDHGPGVPPADRARVLDRFVRLESARTEPGSGLGLSLVAAIAQAHGGQLHLDDNAPGLRITMALPLAEPDRTTPNADAEKKGAAHIH